MSEEAINPDRAVKATITAEEYLSRKVAQVIKSLPPTPRSYSVTGLSYRAIGLIQGLARLNRVAHLQLALAANRAMLEVLVDLVLLVHDKSRDIIDQIEAWELSAKLKLAMATVNYVKAQGKLSELEQPFIEFIARDGSGIQELRLRHWPQKTGKHPDRWTGQNLLQDIQKADQLENLNLEWYYQTEYRRMNWAVHGSALAAFRGISLKTLEAWFSLAHKKTVEFAFEAVRLALGDLNLLEGEVEEGYKKAKERWYIDLLY